MNDAPCMDQVIYPFHLKILDFRYRFLCPRNVKKFAIGLAITHFLTFRGHKNQVAKKPVSSGGMGIESSVSDKEFMGYVLIAQLNYDQ